MVTLVIAYVTLVVGELAPKRVALQRAESTASAVGPTLDRFARLMRPVIWTLSASTDTAVRLLGGDPDVNRERITEEELRDLVTAHEALSRDERALIDEVFEAGERQLREVMVPRTEVEFLDAGWSVSGEGMELPAPSKINLPVLGSKSGSAHGSSMPMPIV